jgi:hypothetical protein
VLASTAKNMLLLDLGMTVSFPTIVIPKLRDPAGPLVLNDEQISWFGKLLLAVLEFTFYLQHNTHFFERHIFFLS